MSLVPASLRPRSARAPRILAGVAFAALIAALAACGDSTRPPAGDLTTAEIASGLAQPIFVTAPAGDVGRVFIVERPGRIRVLEGDSVRTMPFLDISGDVSTDGERGLLSMAFHPRYATNGFFFVYFTNTTGDIVVARYTVSASDSDVADPASRQTIITIPHRQASNHNGGLLLFAPDGTLFFGTGDGGGEGDPSGNGQNTQVLLAKMLRIDVDHGLPYTIPADNPFAQSSTVAHEIWAYGLRNPFRFAIDPSTNLLYIGDVGQNAWEEVDIVPLSPGGENFGWSITEGAHCYRPATGCDTAGITFPQLEYSHAHGCAVLAGVVYRGQALPGQGGRFFYSDYCAGDLRAFRWTGSAVTDSATTSVPIQGHPLSFGEDAAGEIYLTTDAGVVYRIVPAAGRD